MKKQLLSASLLATFGVAMTAPSHAVYNLYKKDGISFDVSGEINLYLDRSDTEAEGQSGALQGYYQDLTDERLRLMTESGASWLDFRGSQQLVNDWRVTGTIGMGYANGSSGYLNSASISFDKLNQGAVTLGRQYLHTGYVGRTGTFTPLDVFGEQAVRLDYYGTDNLHTSAYYLFPSSTDVRTQSNSRKTEGFGASASYTIPLVNDQKIRLAAGYTNSHANPRDERATRKKDGYALSAEYRADRFLVAADYGRSDATLGGSLLAGSKADYSGVKVGVEFTPRFNVVAGYGVRDVKSTRAAGVTTAAIEAAIAANATSAGLRDNLSESYLYDRLKETKLYLRGDYYLRENVRVYLQAQRGEIQGKIDGRNVAKLDDNAYRVGVSLTF